MADISLAEKNRMALQALSQHDKEWFLANYRPEVDEEGYLLAKDGGRTSFMPIQCLGSGTARRAGLTHLL